MFFVFSAKICVDSHVCGCRLGEFCQDRIKQPRIERRFHETEVILEHPPHSPLRLILTYCFSCGCIHGKAFEDLNKLSDLLWSMRQCDLLPFLHIGNVVHKWHNIHLVHRISFSSLNPERFLALRCFWPPDFGNCNDTSAHVSCRLRNHPPWRKCNIGCPACWTAWNSSNHGFCLNCNNKMIFRSCFCLNWCLICNWCFLAFLMHFSDNRECAPGLEHRSCGYNCGRWSCRRWICQKTGRAR